MSLKNWDVIAASNNSAPPAGAPEGSTLLKDINDILRQVMADTRTLAASDTIASATTCDLGSKDATWLTVSGTTTITGLGTVSAGIYKAVTFSGALTLTHNATSLILPGAANIVTVAGDTAIFLSLGTGYWKCMSYQRAAVAPGTASTAASATTLTGLTPSIAELNFVDGVTSAIQTQLNAKAASAIEATTTISTFTNSWTDGGSGYIAAGYWKDAFGVVHLVGNIMNGTADTAAFTLPAGYRPTGTLVFPWQNYTATEGGTISISSSGVVTILGTYNNLTSLPLSHITFRTT